MNFPIFEDAEFDENMNENAESSNKSKDFPNFDYNESNEPVKEFDKSSKKSNIEP